MLKPAVINLPVQDANAAGQPGSSMPGFILIPAPVFAYC